MKKTVLAVLLITFAGFTAAQQSSNLEVNLKKAEPTPLQSSEYGTVWVEVTNNGNTEARNVQLRFQENYPFSVDRGDKKNWSLGTLSPQEEYTVRMQVRVDENAVQGENTLDFVTETGSDIEIEHQVPVDIRTDNAILSIQNIDFPEKVSPGSTNTMTMTLENMADSQLKNIEIGLDFSAETLPMATTDSSTKNIEKIASGETRNISFRINVDEAAENGVYKLPINMAYENEVGTSFEQSTSTGIVVGGEPDLEVGINNENQFSPGSTDTVTFRVVNRGQGSADFVQLALEQSEEYEIISPDSVYLGDMDSDDFQTAEFRIHVNKDASGNVELPVRLDYSDGSGQQTQTQNINLRLYSQQELQRYGLTSNNVWIPAAAVVVLLIAGVVYWRRRKR